MPAKVEIEQKIVSKNFTVEVQNEIGVPKKYNPIIVIKFKGKEVLSVFPSFGDMGLHVNFKAPAKDILDEKLNLTSLNIPYEAIAKIEK